jgi:hypothetical protein
VQFPRTGNWGTRLQLPLKLHCKAEGLSTEKMPPSWYMAPVPAASYGS